MRRLLPVFAACLLAAAPPTPGPSADHARLLDASGGDDWAAFGRTYGEQHYSPLAEIDAGNVKRLGLVWFMDIESGTTVTGPLAIDGVLYVTTGYSIIRAIDAVTGRELWMFDPEAAKAAGAKLRQGWGNRGIAWWNGRIYTGTQDGRLIALDAKTGKPVWSVMTLDPGDASFISGPPRVFDGKVAIGFGGADVAAIRGYVTTYDAETGRQLWRFHTVPGDPAKGFENPAMEMAAKTWFGEEWKKGGGGTVWNAMTYDPETDTLFIGTGNGSPWNHKIRSMGKGDNLFLCSIVALDAKTGAYKWHYQINPGETWDYNAAMDMPLATLKIGGKPRKVIMQAPKNGFFYVLDRVTGELISAEPFAKVNWASHIDLKTGRPVELPGVRYEDGPSIVWPGAEGAHNWLPMSFSPKSGLVYLQAFDLPFRFDDRNIDRVNWKRTPGGANDAGVDPGIAIDEPGAGEGRLLAWNPVTQKEVWRVPMPTFWNGGVLSTAGDIVFTGTTAGRFEARRADNGKLLWDFAAGTAVLAPPITYRAGGRQYVTVLSGMGASGAIFGKTVARMGWDARTQPRRVLTFALDGAVKLPPGPARHVAMAIPDPGYRVDTAAANRGAVHYGQRCLVCHGLDAVAAGLAPDLRESPVVQSAEAFDDIVRGGTLVTRGMPRFEVLTDPQMADLRQYVRSRGRDLAAGR